MARIPHSWLWSEPESTLMTSHNSNHHEKKPSWTSTSEGRHLKARKTRDTEPEVTLRAALHSAGFRFRLHRSLHRSCNPDLVLPRYKIACWVDGCWWHGHEHKRLPSDGPNKDLWVAKIAANRERDARAVAIAESLGWSPVRVWECEIRDNVARVVERIQRIAGSGES